MPPPKLRIRTLIIVVAVAALECRLLVDNPHLGILFLGPLIGSPLMGFLCRNPRDRHIGLLLGGIAGALVETGVLVIFSEGMGDFSALVTGPAREFDAPWPLANLFAGFGVGLTFGVLYVLRLAIVSPANIVEGSPARITDAPELEFYRGVRDHPLWDSEKDGIPG